MIAVNIAKYVFKNKNKNKSAQLLLCLYYYTAQLQLSNVNKTINKQKSKNSESQSIECKKSRSTVFENVFGIYYILQFCYSLFGLYFAFVFSNPRRSVIQFQD